MGHRIAADSLTWTIGLCGPALGDALARQPGDFRIEPVVRGDVAEERFARRRQLGAPGEPVEEGRDGAAGHPVLGPEGAVGPARRNPRFSEPGDLGVIPVLR